jgi:hypothetical protein
LHSDGLQYDGLQWIKLILFEKQNLIRREYGVEQYEKFRQRTDWIGSDE